MILIINPSKKLARSISDTFYHMGILSYGTTPTEALSEISALYRAVLIISPEDFPDARDFVQRIKRYKSDIPLFALCAKDHPVSYFEYFDCIFTNSIFTPALSQKMVEYAKENGHSEIGDYRLSGINASWDHLGVSCFARQIKLTKTETMILRYLIKSYPLPVNAESILKYAFRPSRAPETASIRTHISGMNKKFEEIFGRKMITLVPHEGYLILTPEYAAGKKLL